MLLSMTGFGEARRQNEHLAVVVELRTINSRYFKLNIRCGEGYNVLEPRIETEIRKQIKRGMVQLALRVNRASSPEDYRLNTDVLDSYRRQVETLLDQWNLDQPVGLESLLMLPGVADEQASSASDPNEDWPLVQSTLKEALDSLAAMRAEEGRAMTADLQANIEAIADQQTQIEAKAPQVIEAFRGRLTERLKNTLAQFDVELDSSDIIREVSIFSERSDISEEIVRLRSHLGQFTSIMELPESSGKKLEFLAQEMLRETNTIGSKANDIDISRHVIEIKTLIERLREMLQNVE